MSISPSAHTKTLVNNKAIFLLLSSTNSFVSLGQKVLDLLPGVSEAPAFLGMMCHHAALGEALESLLCQMTSAQQ